MMNTPTQHVMPASGRLLQLSVVVSLLCAGARMLLCMRILSPTDFGLWKTVIMIGILAEGMTFGVLKGIVNTISGHRSLTESVSARDLAASGWVVCAAVFSLIGAATCLWHLVLSGGHKALVPVLGGIYIALAGPCAFLRELASARLRFGLRSAEYLASAVLDVLLTVMLTYKLGLVGFALGSVIPLAFGVAVLGGSMNLPDWRHATRRGAWALVRSGFGYSITEYLFDILRRLPILIYAAVARPVVVGLYSVNQLITDNANLTAKRGVSQVLAPLYSLHYGKERMASALRPLFVRTLWWSCLLSPVCIGAASLVIPAVLGTALPAYAKAAGSVIAALWTCHFVVIHSVTSTMFVMGKRVRRILTIEVVLLACGLILLGGLARWASVDCYAWVACAVLAVYVLVELREAFTVVQLRGAWRTVAAVMAPALSSALLLSAISPRWLAGDTGHGVATLIGRVALFAGAYTLIWGGAVRMKLWRPPLEVPDCPVTAVAFPSHAGLPVTSVE